MVGVLSMGQPIEAGRCIQLRLKDLFRRSVARSFRSKDRRRPVFERTPEKKVRKKGTADGKNKNPGNNILVSIGSPEQGEAQEIFAEHSIWEKGGGVYEKNQEAKKKEGCQKEPA